MRGGVALASIVWRAFRGTRSESVAAEVSACGSGTLAVGGTSSCDELHLVGRCALYIAGDQTSGTCKSARASFQERVIVVSAAMENLVGITRDISIGGVFIEGVTVKTGSGVEVQVHDVRTSKTTRFVGFVRRATQECPSSSLCSMTIRPAYSAPSSRPIVESVIFADRFLGSNRLHELQGLQLACEHGCQGAFDPFQ